MGTTQTTRRTTMAETTETPGKTPPSAKIDDVGVPNPDPLRQLAKDLPANDTVQKAYKDAMLADTAQQEAKAKAVVVDESPNASETPSGGALKAVTGVSNDTERGEKYLREKSARRWGTVPADEA
jgi:hypothetical protein